MLAALISILLLNFIISPYKISGNSMHPVLNDKDRILISKIAVNKINRYDIVVFFKPDKSKKIIIKRIIGLPGEKIEIKKGDIYINDKEIPQPFLIKSKFYSDKSFNMKPIDIPPRNYFIIGDNRRDSQDSRTFGLVKKENILGKAVFRYWPFSKMKKIE